MNDKRFIFGDFYKKYIDQVLNKIINLSVINKESIFEDIYNTMFNCSYKCLIADMYQMKSNNSLIGDSPEERYIYYEKYIGTSDYKKRFEMKYPIVANLLDSIADNTNSYITEIIEHLNTDLPKLKHSFGVETCDEIRIKLGQGDMHNGGRTVAIVEIGKKKLLYKPHGFASDQLFAEVVNFCEKYLKRGLRTPVFLDCGEYGWQEYIFFSECENKEDIKEFYYNSGCFLGIFYILNAMDVHYENVIAKKNMPYFIDMEIITQLDRPIMVNEEESFLKNSVLSTAYIPSVNKYSDNNMCGIFSSNYYANKTIKSLVLVDKYTDNMRLEEKEIPIKETNNIVTFKGKKISVQNYEEDFLNGFQTCLELFMCHKKEYKYILENIRYIIPKFRQILRNTKDYDKFINACLHPEYAISSEKRNTILKILGKNAMYDNLKAQVKSEIDAIKSGNIPYFFATYTDKTLYDMNGIVSENFFYESIYEKLINRIDKLDYEAINFQEKLIRKSLFTIKENLYKSEDDPFIIYKNNEGDRNKVIRQIADEIVSNVTMHPELDSHTMLLHTMDDKITLTELSYDLYNSGGIVWFLTCAADIYSEERYKNISQSLYKTIKFYAMNDTSAMYINYENAFSGIGSMIYLSANMYNLLKVDEYLKDCNFFVSKLEEQFNSEKIKNSSIEYLNGISGLGYMLCKLYKSQILNYDIIPLITKIGNSLVESTKEKEIEDVGLAHGLAGIALSLIAIGELVESEYKKIGFSLIEKDLRQKNMYSVCWCRGNSGTLNALNEILRSSKPSIAKNDWLLNIREKMIKSVIKDGLYNSKNMCLCHGIFGNIDVLINTMLVGQLSEFEKKSIDNELQIAGKLLKNVTEIDLGLNEYYPLESFMQGISGIGYCLLRIQNQNLPSFLNFDIYNNYR